MPVYQQCPNSAFTLSIGHMAVSPENYCYTKEQPNKSVKPICKILAAKRKITYGL